MRGDNLNELIRLMKIITETNNKLDKLNENLHDNNIKLEGILKIIGFYELKEDIPLTKYNVSDKLCMYCNGLMTWDNWEKGKTPIHVDKEGYIIGDGECPKFK